MTDLFRQQALDQALRRRLDGLVVLATPLPGKLPGLRTACLDEIGTMLFGESPDEADSFRRGAAPTPICRRALTDRLAIAAQGRQAYGSHATCVGRQARLQSALDDIEAARARRALIGLPAL